MGKLHHQWWSSTMPGTLLNQSSFIYRENINFLQSIISFLMTILFYFSWCYETINFMKKPVWVTLRFPFIIYRYFSSIPFRVECVTSRGHTILSAGLCFDITALTFMHSAAFNVNGKSCLHHRHAIKLMSESQTLNLFYFN